MDTTELISKDYFDKIDHLTTELYSFANTLAKSRKVLRTIHKDPYCGSHYSNLGEYAMFVKIFVMHDVCDIYKNLRCKLSIFTEEGKIISMYVMKVLSTDGNVDYEIFREMCNPDSTIDEIVEWRTFIDDFINKRYKEKMPYRPNNRFIMQDILEVGDVDLMDMAIEYKDLLNQFANAVADAKGKLTPKQKNGFHKYPIICERSCLEELRHLLLTIS